jgi:spore germination protein GerM
MGFWAKLTIAALLILAVFYIKVSFFDSPKAETKLTVEEEIKEKPAKDKKNTEKKEAKAEQRKYAVVYFLGIDKNDSSLFKKAQREMPDGTSKLRFAMQQLIQGPSDYEKKQGAYSEVPQNTKILGISDVNGRVIIDLSSEIVQGGGADSLYSRIKQIIKTALVNAPDKSVYLYIDGKQADVLGGEGIMLTQPLNENSLDE